MFSLKIIARPKKHEKIVARPKKHEKIVARPVLLQNWSPVLLYGTGCNPPTAFTQYTFSLFLERSRFSRFVWWISFLNSI